MFLKNPLFTLYVMQVEEYIDSFQYELAQKFCQRALEMEPDNLRALETAGSLLLELGNTEAAKQVQYAPRVFGVFHVTPWKKN